MNVKPLMISTKVATKGMLVKQFFLACSEVAVPAIPVCNRQGQMVGELSLQHIIKMSCLPDYMVELSSVLGEQLSCLQNVEAKASQVLANPVDAYIAPVPEVISSNSPVMKALAIMERNKTSYLFIVDNGKYQGVVTVQAIVNWILTMDTSKVCQMVN